MCANERISIHALTYGRFTPMTRLSWTVESRLVASASAS